MRILFSLYVWLVFALTAPLCVALGVVLWAFTAPFDRDRRAMHAWICGWTYRYLKLSPLWQVRFVGRERLPERGCVLVANHQSMADILVLMGLRTQFKWVSKASMFRVPLVGWMMALARYIPLVRGDRASAQAMLDGCRHALGRGVSVLIFPEGTYSPDGSLLPFKRGAFALAIETGAPLVPIVVRGTRELVLEDGPWLNPRCRIEVEVLAPLLPAELGDDAEALAARVRERLGARL